MMLRLPVLVVVFTAFAACTPGPHYTGTDPDAGAPDAPNAPDADPNAPDADSNGCAQRVVFADLHPNAGQAPTLEIFTSNPDGTGVTNVSGRAPDDSQPVWSPQGDRIAFVSEGDIFVVEANGTNPRNLTDDSSVDKTPAWSPDGTMIAYYQGVGMPGRLWVVNADGTGKREVSTLGVADFSWAPNGADLAVSAGSDIHIVHLSGEQATNLTEGDVPPYDNRPRWSSDGSRIAFVRHGGGINADIYTIDLLGQNLTNVTNTTGGEQSAEWSPDSSTIAFYSQDDDHIYTISAAGGQATAITSSLDQDAFPKWSLDGAKLAFVRTSGTSRTVVTINVDGTMEETFSQMEMVSGVGWSPCLLN